MKRNLEQLSAQIYDLVIIGGGIYGASLAWEAASRGLSVALLEKKDFASATSANSLKIIHGGFRYLQNADIHRMRESITERKILMQIAPHLVHPLPVLVPTYGHGIKGIEALTIGLVINELVSFDRNRIAGQDGSVDPDKFIPSGRPLSRRACLKQLPGINPRGLTGGVIFYDAQVYNSERLVLAFLHSASQSGADLANYAEVSGFLRQEDHVKGVMVTDTLTNERFAVRARMVVNTSGPWVQQVVSLLNGEGQRRHIPQAKAINLLTRPLFQNYAVGLPRFSERHSTGGRQNGSRDGQPGEKKGNGYLFVAPWRGRSIVGTTYSLYTQSPDEFRVTAKDLQGLLDEINLAYPQVNLALDDVTFAHGGLLPLSTADQQNDSIRLTRNYQIYDHRQEGIQGLLSVIGVKYTTARNVANKAINQIFNIWGYQPPPSNSAMQPLYGGQIERYTEFLEEEINKRPCNLGEEAVRNLINNYGSAYPEVLRNFSRSNGVGQVLTDEQAILRAEVLHAVRDEMAQKLTDVILRRTDLGTAGYPGEAAVQFSSEVMGVELGWSRERIKQEVQELNEIYHFTG